MDAGFAFAGQREAYQPDGEKQATPQPERMVQRLGIRTDGLPTAHRLVR